MPLEISISQNQFRNDSTVYPRLTISGYAEQPYIKLHDWQYFPAIGESFLFEPNNRSMIDCPVYLRDCKYDLDNWTIDAAVGDFSIVPTPGSYGFFRNGGGAGGSFKGAYYDGVALDGNIVSIQATAQSTQLSTGISLQNSDDPTHDYLGDKIPHSIILGQNGQLSIREFGVVPPTMSSQYKYDELDTAMIEYDREDNIVRYYLIKDGAMFLLRATRPKFTAEPIGEIMLFFPNSYLEGVLIHNGDEAVDTFENIAVAKRKSRISVFQKWKNPRRRISNADPIQLADGEFEFTYPSSKRVLRQIALTPGSYNDEGFQDLEDFYNHHGDTLEFIFVDEARKDVSGNPQEFWARFSGGFGDQTGNGCLFDHNTNIVEAYRGDYIPKLLDTTPPVVVLGENEGSFGTALFLAVATDNIGIRLCRIFVNGVQVGEDTYYNGVNDDYSFSFDTSGYSPSDVVHVVAYDYAGNETISNTQVIGA